MSILKTLLFVSAAFLPWTIAGPLRADDSSVPKAAAAEAWRDPAQPTDARVHDLLQRMSLEEKVSQILANPPAIPRLGIPAYSHRNECLHGIVSGRGTVFPQAIGMAATWDAPLIHEVADVISTEARAQHNDYVKNHRGDSGEQNGLNFYSPNINIFRDPRWGRGQETYGEDPFLTSQCGIAFIRGLQGDDPKYIKVMACAKHFAVHSGPESQRHRFDATPSQIDLHETYLPAFEAVVRQAHVGTVMGAYSALNGTPDCADPFLLTDLLRKQWGFDGVVFSDGGAIGDVWVAHKYVPTPEEAAAAAVKAGCDVSSGGMGQVPSATAPSVSTSSASAPGAAKSQKPPAVNDGLRAGRAYSYLVQAVQKGLISENEIDTSVSRELRLRFRLGMFDPPSLVPWSTLGVAEIDTPEHRACALKVAQESMVLLKNDGTLPLNRLKTRRILVVGPNANSASMLIGNYTGKPSRSVTILDGIKEIAGPNVEVTYVPGCPLARKNDHSNDQSPAATAQAVEAAGNADAVIFVGGLAASLEKEEGRVPYEGFDDGDRTRIELPNIQEKLLKALYATGKPVVFVNCSGSAIAMPWEAGHLSAILQAWYPGEEGGRAVAQVLFGDANPAGRLPVTFYASTNDLPPFADYSMANRTYRYFTGKPLFAFGHGLSYTKFDYVNAVTNQDSFGPGDTIHLGLTIKNSGDRDGDEVAQVYCASTRGASSAPKLSLCAFARVHLSAGTATQIILDIPVDRFRHWDEQHGQFIVDAASHELQIGGASDDIRLKKLVRVGVSGH
jgi:beta-glucosidase